MNIYWPQTTNANKSIASVARGVRLVSANHTIDKRKVNSHITQVAILLFLYVLIFKFLERSRKDKI